MLFGKRIYLRPIEKKDLEILNKWKNDERTFKFLGGGFNPISIDQQSYWMESMIDLTGSNRRYLICELETNEPLGIAGLYDINWIHRSSEVGLYIGNEEQRGKGYASESFEIVEKLASNYLNLRKFRLNVVKNNEDALKLWTNLNFIEVGKLNEERYIDGEYYDVIIMEKFINE